MSESATPMISRYELIQVWGRDNLRRSSWKVVHGVSIPRDAQTYLAEVGLPIQEDWLFRFDAPECECLPRLRELPSFHVIGFDDSVPICVDENRDGTVWSHEGVVGGGVRFVNSSVEQFGEYLLRFWQYRHSIRGVNKESYAQEIIDRIEALMRECDAAALEEDCYWSLILLDMRSGNQ